MDKFYIDIESINPKQGNLCIKKYIFSDMFSVKIKDLGIIRPDRKGERKWSKAQRMCHLLNLRDGVSKEK